VQEEIARDLENCLATFPEDDASRGIYGISVAAELVGTGPQNLRAYERHGLVDPERTEGGTRRYSSADLDRLRRIGELLAAGLNLAGIAAVLDLEATNDRLRAELDDQPRRPGDA
jgi:MerR family transcriptional regulator, heat shock protein HspR